ncbi:MAG: hypothetical protein JW902_08280 [Syntrophaceae bacterium]|nr:hypothetical protein [Syntrophaceae bacterium]
MKVILYIPRDHAYGRRLLSIVEKAIPKRLVAVFNMISALSQGLRGPLADTLLILCPSCRDEVQELSALREMILDVRTILILPDEERETVAIGHQFQPRFLTIPTPDFKDVAKVLTKMLHPRD